MRRPRRTARSATERTRAIHGPSVSSWAPIASSPSRMIARAARSRLTSATASSRRSVVVMVGPQGIGRADVFIRDGQAIAEPCEDALFAGRSCDQVHRVDGALLADAVHAADALFEAHRVPRQLEIDHEAARVVEIQSFARGV